MSTVESSSGHSASSESESRVLLRQARGGGAEALGQLLLQLRPWLRVMAESMLGGKFNARLDASDLVQQTCLSVHRRIEQFTGENVAQFLAWVREIHRCNIRDEIRRNVAASQRSVGREVFSEAMNQVASAEASPERRLQLSEDSVRLVQATDELPPAQRTVAILRYMEGWSVSEIATHMGITPDAVTSLLRRALMALRLRLGDRGTTE